MDSLNNLGTLYESLGKYKKAEEYFVKCYEGRLRVLGKDHHPDTLNSRKNLPRFYEDEGNDD